MNEINSKLVDLNCKFCIGRKNRSQGCVNKILKGKLEQNCPSDAVKEERSIGEIGLKIDDQPSRKELKL